MHDAPLISPDNKDSSRQQFAALPKVCLYQPLPAGAKTPAELADAARALTESLRQDAVVYAELYLCAGAYDFPAADAVDAVLSATASPDVDCRVVLSGPASAPGFDSLVELAVGHTDPRLVGFDVENPAELAEVASRLRAGFVPLSVQVSGFADIAAGVQAGVQRLVHAVDVVDDFSADLDGIAPGKVSAWVRDRGVALSFAPHMDVAARRVEQLGDHPLPLLQQLGFTCAISGAQGSLTDAFVALNETFGYGLEEFFDLTVKAIENSFSTQEQRQQLLETVVLPAYEELADPDEE